MMTPRKSPSLAFSLSLTLWAGLSIVCMLFCLSIVLRLDVAFLESQGMVKSADVREALYMRAFDIDPITIGLLIFSLLAVGVVSYIFSRSQFGYFGKLARVLRNYADTGEIPPPSHFGQFSPHIITFLEVAKLRAKGEDEGKVEAVVDVARKAWPIAPRVHWYDQAQFLVVACALSLFFDSACVIFYLQATSKMVDLSSGLVRFSQSTAPYFFTAQFEIVNPLMWSILLVGSTAFIVTSFRFGKRFSQATYAVLRDLGQFMDGNLEKRLFLRSEDPGRELVDDMNHSLDRIAGQIRALALPSAEDGAATVSPIRPQA